jgi:hypothetical protein
VIEFHRELSRAPRYSEWREIFDFGNRTLAEGQSLTVLLQSNRSDIARVRRTSERFYAPDSSVGWVERLGKYCSHVSNLTLIDLSFIRPDAPVGDVHEHLRAWYYLDALISILDHLADLRSDSRSGVVNLALLQVRPNASFRGPHVEEVYRALTSSEVDLLLDRLVTLSVTAFAHAERSGVESPSYYRLLLLLIPVVMLTSGKDGRGDLVPAYLGKLASRLGAPPEEGEPHPRFPDPVEEARTYHETRYSQQSEPDRTQELFTTEPETPRADMIPS